MKKGKIRSFDTGATRDSDEGKYDYEGFYSPLVMKRFAEYMNKHRKQSDGNLRDSDNWQKGIPKNAYVKSGYRHFFDWWMQHRGYEGQDTLEESICALLFNTQGYLFEILKEKHQNLVQENMNNIDVIEIGDIVENISDKDHNWGIFGGISIGKHYKITNMIENDICFNDDQGHRRCRSKDNYKLYKKRGTK